VLRALSNKIKQLLKTEFEPAGYYDYNIYPIECVWNLMAGDAMFWDNGEFDYQLMVRQPEFATHELVLAAIESLKGTMHNTLLNDVHFEFITDGLCVQVAYSCAGNAESEGFMLIKDFCKANNLVRKDYRHKTILHIDLSRNAIKSISLVLRCFVRNK